MTAQDNVKIIQDSLYAFNNHDLEPTVAFAGDDLAWTDSPSGTVFHGPDGYRQFIQAWFTAFPDVKMVIHDLDVTEDSVTAYYIISGTNTGPLTGHFGQAKPTGRHMEMPFTYSYDISNGRIVCGCCNYDKDEFMRQLGQAPKTKQAGA